MEIDKKREAEINSFLKKLAGSFKKENLTHDQVYYELAFNKIPVDKRVDLSAYFDYWKNVFSDNQNIKVFVRNDWNYFCQFVDSDVFRKKPNIDPIKIYVALKPEYLAVGACQIFNFLATNNIKHCSKIGRVLRDDNIVIRVYDLKEAKKLINYINNNEFLVKGHMDVSPFCFRDGIVGLALDNYLSYNSVICFLIGKYLENKKMLRKLNDVNCHDLYEFVKNFDLKQSFSKGEMTFAKSMVDLIVVNEIRTLFSKSLISSDINEVYRHYYSVSKNSHLINDMNKNNNNNVSNKKHSNKMLDDLLMAMKGTAEKYDDTFAYGALRKYLMIGDASSFTRVDKLGNVCRGRLFNYNYQDVRMEIYKNAVGIERFLNDTLPEFTLQRITKLTDYFYNEFYKKNKDYSR